MTASRRHSRRCLRLKTLAVAMLLVDPARVAMADARDEAADVGDAIEFDGSMLGAAHQGADLSRFGTGTPVDPGLHDVRVLVNGRESVRQAVRFAYVPGQRQAQPCADDALLETIGLMADRRAAIPAQDSPDTCRLIEDLLPGATARYDSGDFQLHLTVPQAYLAYTVRGESDPATWDDGINAARLNYAFNHYYADQGQSGHFQSTSLQLDAGANLGAWRFHHRSVHAWSAGNRTSNLLSAYAQTDLPRLRAQLVLGDFQTSGVMFDSIGLRGVLLQSEDRMWADSQRGYAPTIQGIAHGNAIVTIRQNGQIIHELNVPAGPFLIRDLYPSGYGGALEVTVTEDDGSQETFLVPYSSLAQLLRPGMSRFSAALGEWQGFGTLDRPLVLQGTAHHGLSNLLTLQGGVQGTTGYASLLAGAALNTRIGAFAFDMGNAWSRIHGRALSGQSYRLSYSKYLPATNTSLMVAAHKHTTREFLSLSDHIKQRELSFAQGLTARPRNQFELQLSQPLGPGTLNASASTRDYWDRTAPERYGQIGYSWTVRRVGLSASGRWRDNASGGNGEAYFSLSVPLGGSRYSSHRLTTNGGYARDRKAYGAVSFNGNAGERRQTSFGVTAAHGGSGGALRTGGHLGYEGRRGRAVLNASAGGGHQQWSVSADGGLLWHEGGITAGPTMSETVGLVQARGADGAGIVGTNGARVGRGGFAIMPSLVPYRRNTVELDPRGLDPDLHFDATSADAVPRAGAIVALPFEVRRERSWILRAQRDGADDVPFGAQVHDAAGSVLGVVGQGGLAFLSGEPTPGPLRVQWGEAEHEQCHVAEGIADAGDRDDRLAHVEARCVATTSET